MTPIMALPGDNSWSQEINHINQTIETDLWTEGCIKTY